MTLRQYYHRPYFLPTTAENEKTDWIFMGSPGYGAPMHVSISKKNIFFHLKKLNSLIYYFLTHFSL